MRVTKTIREFIEKEVSNRLDAKSMAFGIKDRLNRSSVLNWRRRKDDEARSIVNDIIVELELGSDKATLMAMLDRVGEV